MHLELLYMLVLSILYDKSTTRCLPMNFKKNKNLKTSYNDESRFCINGWEGGLRIYQVKLVGGYKVGW